MEATLENFSSVLKDKTEIQNMYINGEWVSSNTNKSREIVNPANNEVIATVAEGGPEEANMAVQAAHDAFKSEWKSTYARTRADLLFKLANKLEERKEEFAMLETLNNGKTYADSIDDIEDSINQFQYYAGLATKPLGQTYEVPDEIQAMVVREPVGVVAQIVPWNYPLVMATQKMAAALAAGCTVIEIGRAHV